MSYPYSRASAEEMSVAAFDDESDACLAADMADVEAETRRLLEIGGTLSTALGLTELD